MSTRAFLATSIISISTILISADLVSAGDFTLSNEELMMIKEYNKHVYGKSTIVDRRDVLGAGVEFDIYFPGTKTSENHFECVITKMADPNNPLFASNLQMYDAFALKFTLLAVDGDRSSNHKGRLVVGAYVNAGYRPEVVSLYSSDSNSTVSRTMVGNNKDVFSVGVTMHQLTSDGWDPNGTTITLLIEPVPGAVALPMISEKKPPNNGGKIIYVDCNATGRNDGSSWADAFKNLRSALNVASTSEQIWVAKGVYKPNQDEEQSATGKGPATFMLKTGVAIYGGFPSGGGKWEESDPTTNKTILSGDVKDEDITVNILVEQQSKTGHFEKIFHVVTASGVDETALIDGFIITGGNANGSQYNTEQCGGGLYSKAGSPTISNCTFKLNSAAQGGAISIWQGNPRFVNCRFIENSAGDTGGAIYSSESNPAIINCIFTRNKAAEKGGGIYNENGKAKIINCTMTKNYAYAGGGIYNQKSTPTLANCIIWGNTSRYSADEPAQVYGVKVEAGNCCIQGLIPTGIKKCAHWDFRIAPC
jgi:predicted outer membrane repeat protein